MERFVKGDVVITPFPFSDLSSSIKRPALVVASLKGDNVILCQITSQSRDDPYAIELKKGDFLVSFNSEINPLVKENKEIINEFEFSKNQFSKKIIKRKILLTSELMRLIGYFLAEGHTTKIINQVGFSFNINCISRMF